MDELLIRQLPHSVEAEQAVLGAMLIDARCVPTVIEHLQPEDFYLRQNKEIYESIYSMFSYSATIDPVTVLEKMRQNGTYDENQSRGYILQLMEVTPTAANVMEYVNIVKDKSLLRRVAETAGELTALVQEGTDSGQDVLEAAERLPRPLCLNVNVPKIPADDIQGIRLCRQTRGFWREDFYARQDPHGRDYFWLTGAFHNAEPEAEDTDEWALAHNYVAVVPVQVDMTDYKMLKSLDGVIK